MNMDKAIDIFLLVAAVLMASLGAACVAYGVLLALAEIS